MVHSYREILDYVRHEVSFPQGVINIATETQFTRSGSAYSVDPPACNFNVPRTKINPSTPSVAATAAIRGLYAVVLSSFGSHSRLPVRVEPPLRVNPSAPPRDGTCDSLDIHPACNFNASRFEMCPNTPRVARLTEVRFSDKSSLQTCRRTFS